MLKEVVFSKRNEYTPLYIKTNFLRRKLNYDKQLLDNLFKYLPLETETIEDTEGLLFQQITTYKHSHPFIESTSDVSEYIPYTHCKICGDDMIFHRRLRNNRKHHSLTKQQRRSFPSKEVLINNNTNIRCKSPSLRSKGTISYTVEISECDICMEEKPKDEIVMLHCNHSFCRSCVCEHIENAINNNQLPIKCPEGSCGDEFAEEFVESHVNEEMFTKYKKFIRRYHISLIKNAMCCPYPNCESYALQPDNVSDTKYNDNADENTREHLNVELNVNDNKPHKKSKQQIILKCLENGHEFCLNCRRLPHKGKDCDLREELEWSKFKKENRLQKCPRCGIEIYKDSGCNHMTCSKCGYQFCWICGMKYSSFHYDNPLLPCFRMQYTEQQSILIRSPCIRALKVIGVILLLLIALPIICALPAAIGMGFGIYFLYDEFSNSLSCFNSVVYFITLISLAIALLSFGYLLLFGALIASPLAITFVVYSLCR